MYLKMPRVAFQWIAIGAVQYLATARTAFEMPGRVDIDSQIKLPTNSRNGHFSTLSSSSNSPSFTPTRSGTLFVEVTQNVFIHSSANVFWGIVKVSIFRSRVWWQPPYHLSSPKFLTGTIRFNSSRNTSHLLFSPTANMSSTCATAMISTRPSSTKRKTHASAKHCWKPSVFKHRGEMRMP